MSPGAQGVAGVDVAVLSAEFLQLLSDGLFPAALHHEVRPAAGLKGRLPATLGAAPTARQPGERLLRRRTRRHVGGHGAAAAGSCGARAYAGAGASSGGLWRSTRFEREQRRRAHSRGQGLCPEESSKRSVVRILLLFLPKALDVEINALLPVDLNSGKKRGQLSRAARPR